MRYIFFFFALVVRDWQIPRFIQFPRLYFPRYYVYDNPVLETSATKAY